MDVLPERRQGVLAGDKGPVRMLCVGASSGELARHAASRVTDTRCVAAEDVDAALAVLARQLVHAVVCVLDGYEGRRLFQIMHARYPRVWRVLVASSDRITLEGAAAAGLAHALVTREGTAGIPWLVACAMGLKVRVR